MAPRGLLQRETSMILPAFTFHRSNFGRCRLCYLPFGRKFEGVL